MSQDHEATMEEAGKCDRLEYNGGKDSNNKEDKSNIDIDSYSELKFQMLKNTFQTKK